VTGEVAVLPGVVEVVVGIAAGMADPASIVMDVWGIGMAGLILEPMRAMVSASRRRMIAAAAHGSGTAVGNKAAAHVAAAATNGMTARMLGECRNAEQKCCYRCCE
jgi:hypothetical protein